jgi:hypothetical protein
MMTRLALLGVCIAVAFCVAFVLRRRQPDAPTQASFEIPLQLDRSDFESPATPWLVVVFTSATCGTCADVATKANVLLSHDVAVQRVDFTEHPALHKKYNIEAVPTLVMADHDGVVLKGFLGPMKAQDMWAAMAECRDPGSVPESCSQHEHP